MIIISQVYITICHNKKAYWKNLGYDFIIPSVLGNGRSQNAKILVRIKHLKPNSNVVVECWCERCGEFFSNRYCRNTQYCKNCVRSTVTSGALNARWNNNKTDREMRLSYRNSVRKLTNKNYRKYKHIINPDNLPIVRCKNGVAGYQIDHIKPIKWCYENKYSIEQCADISNLQILMWEDNLKKGSTIKCA